jgi:hypothetical protein
MRATTVLASFLVLGLAVPSWAAQSEAGHGNGPVTLWRGLTTATSRAEMQAFKAALPGKRAELYPGCRAELMYRFVDKRLASIVLLGSNKEAPCAEMLLRDLSVQYGDPRSSTETQATGPFVGGGVAFTGTISRRDHVWHADGRRVVLAMMPGNPSGYNLIFTVRPDKYLY